MKANVFHIAVLAAFVAASRQLHADGVQHQVVLCGEDEWEERRRNAAASELAPRVRAAGYLARAEYERVLRESDVVVSVAEHDFFGVAVVEAIAAGCVPVLPDRLSYPEVVPERYHDSVLYGEGRFRARLAAVLGDVDGHRRQIQGLDAAMMRYDWSRVAPELDAVLTRAAASSDRSTPD